MTTLVALATPRSVLHLYLLLQELYVLPVEIVHPLVLAMVCHLLVLHRRSTMARCAELPPEIVTFLKCVLVYRRRALSMLRNPSVLFVETVLETATPQKCVTASLHLVP